MAKAPGDLPAFVLKTQGWAAGVNIREGVNFMGPDASRPMENIVLNERGVARKRLGCETHGTFGASADRVLSMYTYYRGPGVPPQVLMHTTAGQLLMTSNPDVPSPTWTTIASGLSATAPLSYETFNSKVYFGNGVDPYSAWDGSALTTFPSAPKGRYHRLWKDTMWISGVTGYNDRVYSSAAGDAETFPVPNFVDIGRGDGDTVTALATDGQFLIVGKRDKTATISHPVTLANLVIDYEKGFESHFAVTSYESEIFFLSRRGLCRYLGDNPSQIISDFLDPMFDPAVIALDRLYQATAYGFENKVGFALPEHGSGTNSIILEYYPRLGALTAFGTRSIGPFTFHRMPTQCFTKWRYGASDMLFASHGTANKFLRVFANVGTDDGVSFKAVIQTPFFDVGDPLNTKYLRYLRFICAGRFNLHIYRDYEPAIYRTIMVDAKSAQDLWNNSEYWGSGTWGIDSWLKDLTKTNVDAYGVCFSFRFQDAQEPDPDLRHVWVGDRATQVPAGEWAIYGLAIEGSVLGRRS